MAAGDIASGTFTTYDAVGNREDLNDVIANISPMDTWFFSTIGNGGAAKARYVEWQTDALGAAAENAVYEGGDAPASTAITATTRVGNYCQILRKVFQITNTQDEVDKAGRSSEVSYQTTKHLKEFARDVEYALLINSASASGATGTARKMLGVIGWIATNTASATATGLALTEVLLNSTLQTIWAAGGKPHNVLVGGYVKRTIDAFTTNTRYATADSQSLVAAVDIYKSSFGALAIRLHHQLNTSAAGTVIIFGDMDLWKKRFLRNTKTEELAKTGDSRKFMITAELTLESRQEAGSGMIIANKSS